jgi:hypothetical protein
VIPDKSEHVEPTPNAPHYLLDAKALRRELGVGRDLSYRILREHGRRLGKRLVILRSDLVTFLVEREAGDRP